MRIRLPAVLLFAALAAFTAQALSAQTPPAPETTQTPPAPETTQTSQPPPPASSQPVLEPPPILGPTPQPPPELPILTAPAPPSPQETGFRGTSVDVVRVVLGLFALFGLAYMGGRPWVRELERKLGIAHLVTVGLPFVFLGLIASRPWVGVLSESVLYELRPLLVLGLGWIGFAVGFRFDAQLVRSLWAGVGVTVACTSALPFALVLLACGAMLWNAEGWAGWRVVLRDAVILGTAGSMTAAMTPDLMRGRGAGDSSFQRIRTVVQLEELAAVLGLMLLAAFFRSAAGAASWQLPGTAWLFITIGMGATMGAVIYPILNKIHSGPEFTVVLLGCVSFTAGMASFLRLSPVAVCFIAGAILVNLPGGPEAQIREVLTELERPIYLLFLIVAGSLWRVEQWQGWALMAVFVASRLLGKWLGVWLLRTRGAGGLTSGEHRSLALGPIGALSIAIVVSAEDLYFSSSIPWLVTAVIGGAILTEVIVQLSSRGYRGSEPPLPAPGALPEPLGS